MIKVKHDRFKPNLTYCPPEALLELGTVLSFGHLKYPLESWRSYSQDDHIAAAFRHMLHYLDGEKLDQESGLSHLGHALARLAFAIGVISKPSKPGYFPAHPETSDCDEIKNRTF